MNPILLKAQGLTMRFGGVTALNALDLTVRQDEVLGLIGPNGSGKTTFFNVVTGIYTATSGLVDFDGQDISQYTAQAVYRAGITRTFQRSRLCLPLTVFDNIAIGNYQNLQHTLWFNLFNRQGLKRQYQENLEEAKRLLATFNDKLVDRLFDPVSALTMIDRRRIEICRALISRPRLLLLDEPSAGMTHDETHELMSDILQVRERLREFGNSVTIIIIEHEMNVIDRVTDRCVVLNYGEKIAEGSYAEIAADPEVQRAYLGSD
ncbi:MAG: ABC transporter ATP-binding protein [Betaproteobacteria bacterium]